MPTPTDRRYSESHEWFKLDGDVVTVGITQFAADELTDITYVQLPEKGASVKATKPFGEVESVKATSDVYSFVDGTVVEANGRLSAEPGLLNSDPFGAGWLIRVKIADAAPLAKLMDAAAYEKHTG